MSGTGIFSGTVATFDDDRGLGTLEDAASGETVAFHCTAVLDGSRHIDPGTTVCYTLRPALGGREEARSIVPVG